MGGLFLGGSLRPLGVTVSYLRAPVDSVVATLTTWRHGLGHVVDVTTTDLASLPTQVDVFESPWTTEVLFDCGEWTAYLNNNIAGGDPTAAAPYLSGALDVDLLVAMHSPRGSSPHESTQLWVIGPGGEPPQMYRRTIAAYCADGRWSWLTSGEPLPFERPERYTARRVRDRFDRDLLIAYLAANGVRADEPGFYGAGVIVRQPPPGVGRRATAAEVRREWGW